MNNLNTLQSKLFALSLAVSSSLLVSGCNDASAQQEPQEQEKQEVIKVPVEATRLSVGEIANYYSANAILESVEEADVIAKVQGLIEKVHVEEGDYVEKGQVLAEIDSARYELILRQRKADLRQVKSEFDRLTKVANQSVVSADQLEKLEWQYKSLEAATRLAELDVVEAKVVAPISGYISARYVKPGNLVQGYQEKNLFHIVSQEQLQGVLHLPEGQFSRVKVGQNVSLTLPAIDNQEFIARVDRISPVIDPKSGTFKVVIIMDNTEQNLNAGMFAEVNIEFGLHSDTLLAPASAILSMDNVNVAYQVIDGKAHKIEVQTGFRQDGIVEILTDLPSDTALITAGHNNLKDQADVNIINNI